MINYILSGKETNYPLPSKKIVLSRTLQDVFRVKTDTMSVLPKGKKNSFNMTHWHFDNNKNAEIVGSVKIIDHIDPDNHFSFFSC